MKHLSKKLGVVALITATLAMCFVACKQTGNTGGGGGGTQEAPFVEGGVSLILSPDKLDIYVKVVTADSSPIQVQGCDESKIKSDASTGLHAKGTKVILKGNITKLYCAGNQLKGINVQGLTALEMFFCRDNQLIALNVQGLTALRWLNCCNNQLTSLGVQGCSALKSLWCYGNQLNAEAMTELLKALPAHEAGGGAKAILYTEETGKPEDNCKDFTTPESLKGAFDEAKGKHWRLMKINASGYEADI